MFETDFGKYFVNEFEKKNVLLLVLESLGAHDLFLLGGVAPLGGHNNDGGIDETLGDFDLK